MRKPGVRAGRLQGVHSRNRELLHGRQAGSFWIDAKGRPRLSTGPGRQLTLEWPERSWVGFRLNCSTLAHKSEVGRAFVIVKKALSGKP